jgi:hypothetical protein
MLTHTSVCRRSPTWSAAAWCTAIRPAEAFWIDALGEFALPYEAVATADAPDEMVLSFFGSTHAAAADLAGWDRPTLECRYPQGPDWWLNRTPRPTA